MSWQATAAVAELTENISRSEKLVLLCLANRHNPDLDYAFPSVSRLAREALMSESTCHRVLRSLQEKGFLEVQDRPGFTNVYVLTGVILAPPVSQNDTPTPVTAMAPPGVSKREGRGVTAMAPEPKKGTEKDLTSKGNRRGGGNSVFAPGHLEEKVRAMMEAAGVEAS